MARETFQVNQYHINHRPVLSRMGYSVGPLFRFIGKILVRKEEVFQRELGLYNKLCSIPGVRGVIISYNYLQTTLVVDSNLTKTENAVLEAIKDYFGWNSAEVEITVTRIDLT